jgi:hypothetical protein
MHAEDAEAINSDLDDSDTEAEEDAEEGGQGETDIVFCTYDKVGNTGIYVPDIWVYSVSFRLAVSKINGNAS